MVIVELMKTDAPRDGDLKSRMGRTVRWNEDRDSGTFTSCRGSIRPRRLRRPVSGSGVTLILKSIMAWHRPNYAAVVSAGFHLITSTSLTRLPGLSATKWDCFICFIQHTSRFRL